MMDGISDSLKNEVFLGNFGNVISKSPKMTELYSTQALFRPLYVEFVRFGRSPDLKSACSRSGLLRTLNTPEFCGF